MRPRIYTRRVRETLRRFPAVAILGPRQSGKTTLAKRLGGVYFDMEAAGGAARLDAEWDALTRRRKLVVIDEAQHAPTVFTRLRGAIDADRKRNGRFLLLGSVSPALMTNVAESLAGRLGLVRMTPFILPELAVGRLDDLWLRGGYPDGGILAPGMFPDWQAHYLDALVSRDLPEWGLATRPQQTMRLLAMLAASHGQHLNASQIGASLALDHKTVLRHCDFLEGAFLIRRLPPFSRKVRKRIVKAPRVFWRDSGLLHAMMNVADLDQLYRQPWLGQSWEGFVIEQTLATLAAAGKRAQAFFFRTSDDYELDLLLDWGTDRWAIEVKLTSDPSTDTIGRLHRTADMVDASRRVLVCRIRRPIENRNLLVTGLAGWLRRLLA